MRHCERCGFLETEGYEYPETYCGIAIQEDDPKFYEDEKGCGCRYNLRTLRKKKKEIERQEYLYYLDYYDFALIPSFTYTEENKKILEKHRKLMRHALGMDSRKPYKRHGKWFYRPYRNYFYTHENTSDYPFWERLVEAQLAEKYETDDGINYSVTRMGMDWLGQNDEIQIYDEE